MRVLITGSNGFIAKNLIVRLKELNIKFKTFTRENTLQDLKDCINHVDFIVHLAGVNRPKNEIDFDKVNVGLTKSICDAVRNAGKNTPIIFASSAQAVLANSYGESKLEAEKILKTLNIDTGTPVYIYRLPGVFGKWCKPNYNSVVATFCNNICHNLPVKINDPTHRLNIVYIDDVVDEFVSIVEGKKNINSESLVQPEYNIELNDLYLQIKSFNNSRNSLVTERVGSGLIRKLYSTYISYLPKENFSYSLPYHVDERGIFAEILKTKDSGQFSFFTAKQGVTRGGHYHHSKTEKFLVVKGEARFGFRNIISNETHEIITSSKELRIVEAIPGWSHDITNIGKEDIAVILWSNEIFDLNRPDTFPCRVKNLKD